MSGVDVRHLLQTHGLAARKALGQCFLHDVGVLARIGEAAAGPAPCEVVEIGAGLGALTATLAGQGHRVHAIEKDARLIPLLQEIFRDTPAVRIVHGDATELELAALAESPRPTIAGNLPYSVSSPLLLAMLGQREHIGPATVMLQREVAERLTAHPGTKEYGSLTALFGLVAHVRHVLDVGPGAFSPPPSVHSTVIRIEWRDAPHFPVPSVEHFERVTRAAFSQRRKTLRNALQTAFPRTVVEAAGAEAQLDLGRRAETLSVEELAGLSRAVAAHDGQRAR